MQLFKGFIIYDFNESFFFMFIRRNLKIDKYWLFTKRIIEQQIKEQNVIEEKTFQLSTIIGKIRGKFDIIKKRLLLLISNQTVEDIFLAELLSQIYANLIDVPSYNNLKVKILEKIHSPLILQIIQQKEQHILEQNQLRSELISTRVQTQKEISINQLNQYSTNQRFQRFFRGFIIYNCEKQFFMMFIRQDFNNDKCWLEQRNKIENYLNEQKPTPSKQFQFACLIGKLLFEYDLKSQNYFMLISNFKCSNNQQSELLEKIINYVRHQPEYYKMTKSELEDECLMHICDIMDAEERIHIQQQSQTQFQKLHYPSSLILDNIFDIKQ